MNTPITIRDGIFAAFVTHWANLSPVAWPGVKFDPQTDVPDKTLGFIRIDMMNASGEQAALGSMYFSRKGVIAIQCFSVDGDGTDKALELADKALEYFETAGPGLVWYRNPSIIDIGAEGSWYQVNASIEFEYRVQR
jgi:hypothetical protein